MIRRLMKLFTAVLSSCLLLSGCTMIKTQAAYTVYPVGFLIGRLAGETITAKTIQTESIVQRSQIRGDYEEILNDSEVFFHIGLLEPYLNVYSSEINALPLTKIDLSTMNAVYDFQRYS